MIPDDSILSGLKRGEPSAFDWLISCYEGPLFRYFYCRLSTRRDAEDLTADTFAALVVALPRMTGNPAQLPAFVYSTAKHIRHVQYRRDRKNLRGELPEEIASRDGAPDAALQADEELRRVLAAINTLDADCRDALLLQCVEDRTIEEIANILDMKSGTVKSHLHRGRAKLKELLSREDSRP